ncbi:MAG: hypothetical protein FJ368_02575 [Pelagibacterales bacterium]|nr:hypothetical protein [Pelagibacterales bacterium]
MLNIFNLFLVLFSIWSVLMLFSENISWLFAFLGIICSSSVSLICYKIKLIDKKSDFPFLHVNFYSHFLSIYVGNFLGSLKFLLILAFASKDFRATKRVFKIKEEKINNFMMIATINMTVGLTCLDCSDNNFLVYSVSKSYFKGFDFDKVVKSLTKVNDDEI